MATPTLVLTVLLAGSLLLLPRKYFLLPYVIAACFVPADQRIIIADLDFTPLRFCVLFGVLRLHLQDEAVPLPWNRIDKLVVMWVLAGAAIYVVQWQTGSALINRAGVLFDCLGMYWVFRQSIRSWSDVSAAVRWFATCCIVTAPFIVLERVSQYNIFSILGNTVSGFIMGRFRCGGPFPHSIMMGLFWASLMPLFLAPLLFKQRRGQFLLALAAACTIVILSASSTPIMTMLFIFGLFCLFKYRRHGKAMAWGVLAILAGLHLVMKAPVWHLLARVNIISGSTGYHRYHLIDEAINHIDEWILIGTRGTAHWGWDMADVTNQYILEGVRGGMLTLVIFVWLLIRAVQTVGRLSLEAEASERQWMAWGICVSILGHCISFIGVSYFGQINMLLYMTLAIAGFVSGQEHGQTATVSSTAGQPWDSSYGFDGYHR